jgi:hypothetical protein
LKVVININGSVHIHEGFVTFFDFYLLSFDTFKNFKIKFYFFSKALTELPFTELFRPTFKFFTSGRTIMISQFHIGGI